MVRLRVRDRVITSHDACTSETSRVLTVASLQRLKMEPLIPAPADCEMRSVIKFLNAQSIESIEIHRQLCHVYGHARLDGQHISCRSSAGRCLIIHLIARTSRPVIFISSYASRNFCPVSVSVFKMKKRPRWVTQWFQSQATNLYDAGYKSWSHGMTNDMFWNFYKKFMNVLLQNVMHMEQFENRILKYYHLGNKYRVFNGVLPPVTENVPDVIWKHFS